MVRLTPNRCCVSDTLVLSVVCSYLDNNVDLQTALGATNLTAAKEHFLSHGYAEGLNCTCPGGCNWNW